MRWWETPGNNTCLFALDHNSDFTKNSLFFSNNSNYLTTLNGDNLLSKNIVSGFTALNLKRILPIRIDSYKSLKIDKTNLLFNTPLFLPNNFTIVLKAKINGSSLLMSNNGNSYGLTFGTGEYNAASDSAWRIDGFRPEGDYTKSEFDSVNKGYIQTVVLRGDIANKQVEFITDYGTFTVPQESTAFQKFLVSQTYTTLGYQHTHTSWRPDLDIIAYGLFNKILTDEELDNLFLSVDNTFKIKSVVTYIKTDVELRFSETSKTSNIFFENPYNVLLNISYIDNKRIVYYPEILPGFDLLPLHTEEVLYEELEHIEDVVLEEGVPVQIKLYLYEKETGSLLKTTVSDKQGNFSFLNLKKAFEYIVTANDPKYQFQSVIKNYNN